MSQSMIMFVSAALIPVALLVLSFLIFQPVLYVIRKYMPDCWLKRLLLTRTN